jgi:hypothetical protein
VASNGIFVRENKKKRRLLEADSVILSTGFASNRDLHEGFKDDVRKPLSVGDCVEPRKIFDAVHEAALIANSV